ncbi:MAG TPA: hypothetical protein VM120_06120 [Bryobacteraceae bacterium]|nr:hypothetical protein [Bryobacteraceae bacterium]
MNRQAIAILWAQWRASRNFYARGGKAGFWFGLVISLLWYGIWGVAAVAVTLLVRETKDKELLYRFLAPGLMLGFLYWQIIPVLMVTSGASLQMKRLMIYPIPHSQLFGLEVLLRVTTAWEMLLLLLGATVGLMLSPILPFWYAAVFLPYLLFNLFVSAGIRDLITRMLAWRRFREGIVLFLILMAAAPQMLLRSGVPAEWRRYLDQMPVVLWPWIATAKLISGDWAWRNIAAVLGWMMFGYAFGRWQFERGLRFDEEAARSAGNQGASAATWTNRLFRLPGGLWGDPLAAMVEKELRTLVRSPRFRIVFIMGFSFGLIIWLPMALGRRNNAFMEANFLVVVCAYAMMLLSEVTIWNVLGFDRSAAQIYWLAPVRTTLVLVAKNITTVIFLVSEFVIITLVCLLFRLKVTAAMFIESVLVCLILLLFLVALGNHSSLRYPRPVDPKQNWKRSSTSRFQAMLLFFYPVMSIPFAFAYYARLKWESDGVFYGILAFTAVIGGIAYGLSLESAEHIAFERKEKILTALAQGEGPVSS